MKGKPKREADWFALFLTNEVCFSQNYKYDFGVQRLTLDFSLGASESQSVFLEPPMLSLSISLCMGMKVRGRGKVRYARLSLSVCVTARACGSGLGFVCVWIGFLRALRSQEIAKSVTLPLFVRFVSVWIKRNLVSNQGKCFEKLTEACKVALINLLLFLFFLKGK